MNDKTRELTDDDVRSIHEAILNDWDQSVRSIAKDLKLTPAALYYRFDALKLEAPDDVRIRRRNVEIVKKYDDGTSVSELRELYKLSKPSIYSILRKGRNEKRTESTK